MKLFFAKYNGTPCLIRSNILQDYSFVYITKDDKGNDVYNRVYVPHLSMLSKTVTIAFVGKNDKGRSDIVHKVVLLKELELIDVYIPDALRRYAEFWLAN